jgi:hypothetical protein
LQFAKKSCAMGHATPDQDTFLRGLAGELASRGLRLPASIVLAAGRPLAFLLGQAMWVFQPAASLFWSRGQITALANLLEDELALARLQEYLSREDPNG